MLELKTHIPQKYNCNWNKSTHSYFSQVDAIIQRVPGTLLVVRPPGLLEDLADALAFLTFVPISTGDARCPWDAIGPRITLSARGACWALHAATKLEKTRWRRSEGEVDKSTSAKSVVITLPA